MFLLSGHLTQRQQTSFCRFSLKWYVQSELAFKENKFMLTKFLNPQAVTIKVNPLFLMLPATVTW